MKNFPKVLYVKIEKEREPEDDFLIADEDVSKLSEPESIVSIGVYDLVCVKVAVNKTELVNDIKEKK